MVSCLRRAWLAAVCVAALGPTSASAAMIGFSSENSGFRLFDNTLEFGTNVGIDLAEDDGGVPDATLVGYTAIVSDVYLTGSSTPSAGGVTSWAIDATPPVAYTVTILDGNGSPVLTAAYDPGEFLTIGSAGALSPQLSVALSNVSVTGQSAALADLANAAIDLSVVLSAGGQDFAAKVGAGQAVTGTMAGTLASIAGAPTVPEPGSLLLLGAGLAGLTAFGRKRG